MFFSLFFFFIFLSWIPSWRKAGDGVFGIGNDDVIMYVSWTAFIYGIAVTYYDFEGGNWFIYQLTGSSSYY